MIQEINRNLLSKNHTQLISAFLLFNQAASKENSESHVLLQNFLRYAEILINVFFRIIEHNYFQNISVNEMDCIERMISLKVLDESNHWEIFLKIKNNIINQTDEVQKTSFINIIRQDILPFSQIVMKSIKQFINKTPIS